MANFWQQRSKREKTVLSVCLVFVAAAVIDRGVVSPIAGKMRSLDEEIDTTMIEIEKNTRIMELQDQIESDEKKYASFSVSGRSQEEETALLLRAIERLAAAAHVSLIDLKPAGTRNEGSVVVFDLNISCEGRMEDLMAFFYDLETTQQLIEIVAFSFTRKGREDEIRRCDMVVNKRVIF